MVTARSMVNKYVRVMTIDVPKAVQWKREEKKKVPRLEEFTIQGLILHFFAHCELAYWFGTDNSYSLHYK